MTIRDVLPTDLPRVLQLNEAAVPNVNSIPLETMEWFAETAPYFRVADLGDRIGGFLIALGTDSTYESINYLWFRQRYEAFVYIDRIVVSESERGRGIGKALYDDLAQFTRVRAPILACEVNLVPRNDVSLRFHSLWGFREVGRQPTEGGTKLVSLMVRDLK